MTSKVQHWEESDINEMLRKMLYKSFMKNDGYSEDMSNEISSQMVMYDSELSCNCGRDNSTILENILLKNIKHTGDVKIIDISNETDLGKISDFFKTEKETKCICFRIESNTRINKNTLMEEIMKNKQIDEKVYIWITSEGEENVFTIIHPNSSHWILLEEKTLYEMSH